MNLRFLNPLWDKTKLIQPLICLAEQALRRPAPQALRKPQRDGSHSKSGRFNRLWNRQTTLLINGFQKRRDSRSLCHSQLFVRDLWIRDSQTKSYSVA